MANAFSSAAAHIEVLQTDLADCGMHCGLINAWSEATLTLLARYGGDSPTVVRCQSKITFTAQLSMQLFRGLVSLLTRYTLIKI